MQRRGSKQKWPGCGAAGLSGSLLLKSLVLTKFQFIASRGQRWDYLCDQKFIRGGGGGENPPASRKPRFLMQDDNTSVCNLVQSGFLSFAARSKPASCFCLWIMRRIAAEEWEEAQNFSGFKSKITNMGASLNILLFSEKRLGNSFILNFSAGIRLFEATWTEVSSENDMHAAGYHPWNLQCASVLQNPHKISSGIILSLKVMFPECCMDSFHTV